MDDESREIYDARMEYFITMNEEKVLGRIAKIAKENKDISSCWSLDSYYKRHPEKKKCHCVYLAQDRWGYVHCTLLKFWVKK